MAPDTGDPAPDFSLPDADGETRRLSDLRGKHVVLFFYPRDDTSGCTKEALEFTAAKGEFKAAGAVVIGISPDSPDSHRKFRDKHQLSVTLLADSDREAIEAYDVWRMKSMYGRKFLGLERSTFLIGPDGRIVQAWRKVRVKGHVADVLAAVKDQPAPA